MFRAVVLATFTLMLVLKLNFKALWTRPSSTEAEEVKVAKLSFMFKLISEAFPELLDNSRLTFQKHGDLPLDMKDGKYFFYLPFEGMGNQLLCLLRALHTSQLLNRTLLIPPLMGSLHNKNPNQVLDWRDIIEFSSLRNSYDPKLKFEFIGHNMLKQIRKMLQTAGSECYASGQYTDFETMSYPSRSFLRMYGLTSRLRFNHQNATGTQLEKSKLMMKYLNGKSEMQLVCVINLLYISYGTDMNYLWSLLKPSRNVIMAAWNFLQFAGVGSNPYAAVHWRRGDFKWACKRHNHTSCWPDLGQLQQRILSINKEYAIDIFLIGTNDSSFELDMTSSGIDVIPIRTPPATDNEPAAWIELAPVAIDEFIFTYADYFLGNAISSLSFSAIQKRKALGLREFTSTF